MRGGSPRIRSVAISAALPAVLSVLLFGVGAARADLVYTRLEPPLTFLPPGELSIDIDNDGSDEFRLTLDLVYNLVFVPEREDVETVFAPFPQYPYARAYVAFEPIRCTDNFQPGEVVVADSYYTSSWVGRVNGFLALRFERNGATHLGWVRMDVSARDGRPLVKDYAYNDVPVDQPGGCEISGCVSAPPTITCPPTAEVECGGSIDPSATGTPVVGGSCNVSMTVTFSDEGGSACGGTIVRTWRAENGAFPAATCTQIIHIADCSPATITCPPDVSVSCGGSTDPSSTGFPTVGGTCDLEPTVTFTDEGSGACGTAVVRTWRARFGDGPEATCVQNITVEEKGPGGGEGCLLARLLHTPAQAEDWAGQAVAIGGDYVLVGAPRVTSTAQVDIGSAFVFLRSGLPWSQQARLQAGDGAELDGFGSSVGISGALAVVGSPADDDAGTNSGSAYVFERSGATWTQTAKLTAADGASFHLFGIAVAIDGLTIVVGARGSSDHGPASGSAYVFVRSGGMWSQQAKLTASDASGLDQFGNSVAIDGDTIVVGAHRADTALPQTGAAYVFVRSGGTWSEQAKLVSTPVASSDRLGTAVGVKGDTAIVGAPFSDVSGSDAGAAYVFTRSGVVWTQQAELLPDDAAAGKLFGSAVAVDGSIAAVGAPDDEDEGSQRGAVYVFAQDGGTWAQRSKLRTDGVTVGAKLGSSVALDGGFGVTGAPQDDPPPTNAGAAYTFFAGDEPDCNENGTPDPCDIASGTSADANNDGIPDECGAPNAACEGDMNGDGRVDGADIQTFVDCVLAGPTRQAGCECADHTVADGVIDAADTAAFVERLLNGS